MQRFALILLAMLVGSAVAYAHEKEVEGEPIGVFETQPEAPCESGLAQPFFPCFNVDLVAWLPTSVFGQVRANDIWGWTDHNSGVEYALVGLRGGTAFVDLGDPEHPVYLGFLPTQTSESTWRDIKTYENYAFIVSEAGVHGLQIFDLSVLAKVVDPPVVFTPTLHYDGFGHSHNLALDEETGTAFALGSDTCGGGPHMVDVTRPEEPLFAGCFSGDGYTHDAQCVVYRGPDVEYQNREICFNSNETTVTIVDVTSRDAPRMLSRTSYEGRRYTHQGWLTEDHRFFLLGDELDERSLGHNARTYIWDVRDLDAPFVTGTFTSSQRSVDHNLFVVGNHVFEANYLSGLRVLRMGDLSRAELAEVAFFDTTPFRNGIGFNGAWGVYPFFESGIVLISDINNGLFVLSVDLDAVPECSDGIDNDLDGLVDSGEDPSCADGDGATELPRNDVAIDVKPGDSDNVVNPFSRGGMRVAILGSPSFDVYTVDPETVHFGPGEAPIRRSPVYADVDGDAEIDLTAKYLMRYAGVSLGDAQVCLHWQTRDGTPYEDCDAIRTVGHDRGDAGPKSAKSASPDGSAPNP